MNSIDKRVDKISDIGISMGQIFFASVFIEPIVNGDFNVIRIIFGFSFAIISWIWSVLLIKK